MTKPDLTLALTGSVSGIGKAIAEAYRSRGWRVLCADLSENDSPQHCQCDLSTPEGCSAFCEFVEERTSRLDALVNNAAVMLSDDPEKLPLKSWQRVLNTNLTAPFLLTRRLTPLLRRGRGRVVNLTSTRAHMSEPHTEAYAASKGGLLALTHALAISLGPEIKVNCISPGWIHTGDEELSETDHHQHPAGRVGTTGDIVGLLDYLLAEETTFVTGSEFVIDGGMTRKMIYAE